MTAIHKFIAAATLLVAAAANADTFVPEAALKIFDRPDIAQFIDKGTNGRDVYVFVDPYCPYSKETYYAAHFKSAKSTVHWIPVSILKNSSESVVDSAIAGGAKAFANAMGRDTRLPDMGRHATSSCTGSSTNAVCRNNLALQDLRDMLSSRERLPGTPFIVVLDPEDERWKVTTLGLESNRKNIPD